MKTSVFKEMILKNEHAELTILPEAGCHWPRLRIPLAGQWTDLLFPVEDYAAILSAPSSTGSYIMAPWSNRLPGGVFEFEGKRYPLRINFPGNTAIHGDVRKRAWTVLEASSRRFQARLDSGKTPDFNYPFRLLFEHTVELKENTLFLNFTIENKDTVRAPVGFGYHPFFKRQLVPGRKDPVLILPANKVFPARAHRPTGPALPVSGRTDLRQEKPLGSPELDDCFTDFSEHKIKLIYPEDGVKVIFEMDPAFSHTVIYVPNKADGRPGDFFAIEPVTHVTNGFNLLAQGWKDTGVKVLNPGEKWGGGITLTISRSSPVSRRS